MLAYAIRRVLAIIPLLFAIATITFFLMHSVEGGPFDEDKPLPPATRANLERRYGLDDPLPVQYVTYLKNLASLDFGISIANNRDISDIIKERMRISVQLGIAAFLFATTFGLTLGIVSSLNQNGLGDYFGVFVATAGAAMPSIVLAPLLTIVFAVELGWFKVLSTNYGFTDWLQGDFSNWKQVILPTIGLGFLPMAFIARITRASMLEVLRQDYIRTARAKGLRELSVVIRHAAKNALIPVLTVLGPIFAGLITGSLVIERFFAIPGLGGEFVRSVIIRDYGLIMGVTVFFAVIIAFMNLVVDLLYGIADPRIRY
ncbi:MAG: ABC transporter permease [Chloroflexi bacterium]|nr:ABC transporter permease [Dehalococcoidia bacterium]MCO5200477.1 ABC transporter permease [Chloroflexota bacterium]MCZ7575942.1 ABC transporter permease [Dehalococcoidia bacterium]NJD64267.1 ABC transporter permease [Chloroflexota bacterium]PWB43247.1 MAG: peptide ABC transporter permease [Dehalococcoidia bacterium]